MANTLQSKRVLVTGGAGYIGSFAVYCLKQAGFEVGVIDNLVFGHRYNIEALKVPFWQGDVGDKQFVAKIIDEFAPASVMHFAAYAYVGESVTNPEKYYNNNFVAALNLISVIKDKGIKNFIFSSTCATYGVPKQVPITEETPQEPINPYGRTKLNVEKLLSDFEHAYALKSVAFRYFNASGAHPQGILGEDHNPETHLIPLTIYSALGGPELKIFGNDYPTQDGTCIRDYIHVLDIAEAHVLGLKHLLDGGQSLRLNIGTGIGNSNLEIINAVEKVSGKKVRWSFAPRRDGDPPALIASAEKLTSLLGWKPKFTEIEATIRTAWEWHRLRHAMK